MIWVSVLRAHCLHCVFFPDSTHLYDKWLWLYLIWTLTNGYRLSRGEKVIGRKYSIWKKTCTIKHIIIFKWKGHLRFLNGSFKMIGNNGRISPLFIYKGISITKLLNVRVQKALINKLILTFYNRSHFLWIVSIRNYFNNLTVFFFLRKFNSSWATQNRDQDEMLIVYFGT